MNYKRRVHIRDPREGIKFLSFITVKSRVRYMLYARANGSICSHQGLRVLACPIEMSIHRLRLSTLVSTGQVFQSQRQEFSAAIPNPTDGIRIILRAFLGQVVCKIWCTAKSVSVALHWITS